MARRAGGYKKSDPTEWAECARSMYGEAVVSANRLGQDVYVWMNDAIAHHVYRVEQVQAQQQYRADMEAFNAGKSNISPQQYDPKYQVSRPRPEITQPGPGQGSAASGPGFKP